MAAYPGRIEQEENYFVAGGSYLSYVPEDKSDRTRVVFETDQNGNVDYIRAGRLPEVDAIEGCV